MNLLLRLLAVSLYLPLVATTDVASAKDQSALWRAVKSGGHIVLMRHAIAPGIGDPQNFRLDDCATQRNLDAAGRAQAQRIGARMRTNGIAAADVFSSQWCRTTETARLLGFGPVESLSLLNSFYRLGDEAEQTVATRRWLAARDLSRPTVLVTHQVNITALTGVYPASGAMVVVRPGGKDGLEVVGTIEADGGN